MRFSAVFVAVLAWTTLTVGNPIPSPATADLALDARDITDDFGTLDSITQRDNKNAKYDTTDVVGNPQAPVAIIQRDEQLEVRAPKYDAEAELLKKAKGGALVHGVQYAIKNSCLGISGAHCMVVVGTVRLDGDTYKWEGPTSGSRPKRYELFWDTKEVDGKTVKYSLTHESDWKIANSKDYKPSYLGVVPSHTNMQAVVTASKKIIADYPNYCVLGSVIPGVLRKGAKGTGGNCFNFADLLWKAIK